MKDGVKFWCVIAIGKQGAFREDGTTYEVEKEMPVGEQHILFQGVLMCGKSRDGIQKYRKGKKAKTTQLRIENLPLCKGCEQKYKANSNLMYTKWVQAVQPVQLHGVNETATVS